MRFRNKSAPRALLELFVVIAVLSTSFVAVQAQRPENHTETLAHAEAKSQLRPTGRPKPIALTQNDYDVLYYKLDLDFDPGTQLVSGSVHMRAAVTSPTLTTVEVDLYDNMTVSGITSNAARRNSLPFEPARNETKSRRDVKAPKPNSTCWID